MYLRVSTTSKNNQSNGFTIVELLIVIVIIAVLAVITVVAYNGVQARARASAVQSGLSDVTKKLAAYMVENSTYPPDLTGLSISTGGTNYQYTVDTSVNPATYCVTGTVGSTSYKTDSSNTQAVSGGCVGHTIGSGATIITNLLPNPSVEVGLTGYVGPNASVVTRDTTRAYTGTYSTLTTMPVAGVATVGTSVWQPGASAVPTVLKASTVYNYSAWVYVPTGTVNMRLSSQGTGISSGITVQTAVKDAWTRLAGTFTTSASGGVALYVLNQTATGTAGTQAWIDAVQVTEGATTWSYGDGTITDWAWVGTAHASASYGPAF